MNNKYQYDIEFEMQWFYGAFFTEKWANQLGEQVTGEESIGDLMLD